MAPKTLFNFFDQQKDNRSEIKICQCFSGQEVSPEGRCIEEKDLGILDLKKMFRKPFWSELNPGRKNLSNSRDLERISLIFDFRLILWKRCTSFTIVLTLSLVAKNVLA